MQEPQVRCSLDLRYTGQSSTLNLPWESVASVARAFHAAHEDRYGHALDLPVELVNVRCGLSAPVPDLRLPALASGPSAPPVARVSMHGVSGPVPVHARDALRAGQDIMGPALITETVSTTWIAPGWRCEVDAVGNLVLTRGKGS